MRTKCTRLNTDWSFFSLTLFSQCKIHTCACFYFVYIDWCNGFCFNAFAMFSTHSKTREKKYQIDLTELLPVKFRKSESFFVFNNTQKSDAIVSSKVFDIPKHPIEFVVQNHFPAYVRTIIYDYHVINWNVAQFQLNVDPNGIFRYASLKRVAFFMDFWQPIWSNLVIRLASKWR